jgi:hypothetical protein
MVSDIKDDEPALHIIFSEGNGYSTAPSFLAALRKAWERYARATSVVDTPKSIWQSGTDKRWDTQGIVAEWDARGWPRPTRGSMA